MSVDERKHERTRGLLATNLQINSVWKSDISCGSVSNASFRLLFFEIITRGAKSELDDSQAKQLSPLESRPEC